ncbi:MAG: FAD-dependent oxidoreductase, partial [Eggerthellaceae bacterium]|nr:FAD-dependent oxidoreductase [Eggerthellaceae bacterium]
IPPMGSVDYNWTLPIAKRVKEAVSIPVASVGRVISVEAGEKILEDNDADIIGYGRSLMTDPDIALKVESGEPIRECLNCNKGCVDAISNRRYISCVLNAENGDETTIYINPIDTVKNVLVIGAGIAGLEAARVSAVRGHNVTLIDKADRIGGQIHLAAASPRKDEIMRSVEYYEKILPTLNVDVKLNTEADDDYMNSFDYVVIAVGAHNMDLPMKAENSNIVSAWDVLNGEEVEGEVVVLGGGLVGTETAEYLADRGY